MLLRFAETVAIGLASGVLSGMFGIGGGVLTTPAIRLLLGAPALVAVGTPLVAIIPSAVTGAFSYARSRIADVRSGLIIAAAGALSAIAGAWATKLVGGTFVLVATAAVIVYAAADMALQVVRPPKAVCDEPPTTDAPGEQVEPAAGAELACERPGVFALAVIGLVTGFYSGFLGLGGGFIIVPMLTRWQRFSIKRAIGTSLVAVSLLAVPGTITHSLLGHIDWGIAAALVVGVIPGAMIGAKITLGTSDRHVRIGFAVLFSLVGIWLAVSELLGLGV